MMDYSELVKDLRHCADMHTYCSVCKYFDANCEQKLIAKAADAIEELQRELQLAEFDADNWRDAYHHWFENYQNDVPKWIPVTERLPQDAGIYIICDHYGNVMSRHFCKSHGKNYKPMTNADRIRAMTDEELARWIATTADDNCPDTAHERYCDNRCGECWLDWLKSPVEGGDNG